MLPLPHRPQGLLGPKERVVLIYKGHPYLLLHTTLINSTSSGGGRHPPPLYGYRYLTQLSFQNCGLPCTTSASSSARLSTVKVDHPLDPRIVGTLSRMVILVSACDWACGCRPNSTRCFLTPCSPSARSLPIVPGPVAYVPPSRRQLVVGEGLSL